jgi:hypothetical protein
LLLPPRSGHSDRGYQENVQNSCSRTSVAKCRRTLVIRDRKLAGHGVLLRGGVSQIHFIGGENGGVGKSVRARSLAQ